MIVLDASVLIAFLDPTDAHHSSARDLVRSASGQALGASVLTIAEVMVAPARAGGPSSSTTPSTLSACSVSH